MAAGSSGGLSTSQTKKLKQEVWDEQIAYLTEELGDPSRYFPYLMSKGVLSGDDCARVKAEVTNSEKVRKLVEIVKKRESKLGDPSLDVFVDALKKQKVQAHIARALQRAYAKKKEVLELKLEGEREEARSFEPDDAGTSLPSESTTPVVDRPSSSINGPSPPLPPSSSSISSIGEPQNKPRHEIHAALGPIPNPPPKVYHPPTVNGNSDVHSKYGPRPPSPPPSTDTTNMYPYKATTPHHAEKTQMALGMPPMHSMMVAPDPTSELEGQFDKIRFLEEEEEEQGGEGQTTTTTTSILSSLSSHFSSFPSDTASEISSQLISGKMSLDVSGLLSDVSSDAELVEKLIEENMQLKQQVADCNSRLKRSDMDIIEYRRQTKELTLMLQKYSDYETIRMELQQERMRNASLLQSSAQGKHQQHYSKLAEDSKVFLQEIDQLKQQVFNLDREKNELKIQADEFQLQRDGVIRDFNVLQMSLRPHYLPVGSRQQPQQQQQQQQHFVMGGGGGGGPLPPAHPHGGYHNTFQQQQLQMVEQQQQQQQPFNPPGAAMMFPGEQQQQQQALQYVQHRHPHSAPHSSSGNDTPPQQHFRHHHSTQHYHVIPSPAPAFGNNQFPPPLPTGFADGGGGGQLPPFGQSPSSLRSSNTSISSFGGSGMRQI